MVKAELISLIVGLILLTSFCAEPLYTSPRVVRAVRWSSDFRPHGAYVDEIVFVIYSPQGILAHLQSGNIDAIAGQAPTLFFGFIDPEIRYVNFPGLFFDQLILNNGRFPTNLTAFRRAMAFGVDKIMANVDNFGGGGIPLDSYIPLIATEWEVESQLNEHFYEADYVSGNTSLENAGFTDLDGDGWREYDKNSNGVWDNSTDLDDDDPALAIEIYADQDDDPTINLAMIAQDGLEHMGMRSTVVILDSITLQMNVFNGNFWAFSYNTVVEAENIPVFLYDYFRTGQDFNDNVFRFSNPTIDAILDDMDEAITLENVKEKVTEVVTLLVYEQPSIVFYSGAHVNAYRTDKLEGFFEFKGNGFTGGNPYCATKVHLNNSLGGPLGGTFRMSTFDDLETTNILMVSEKSTTMIMGYVYEELWQVDPNTWDPIPGLAYNWTIEQTTTDNARNIQDGQKWTFYLYKNATWHDGHPVTSEDVRYSFETIWPTSPFRQFEIDNIYRYEIPDEHTIAIYTNKSGYFEWGQATSHKVLPKHIWENVGNFTNWIPNNTEIIGSGPYKWDQYVPGEYVSLLRHEDWHWDIREVLDLTTSTTSLDSITTSFYLFFMATLVIIIRRQRLK